MVGNVIYININVWYIHVLYTHTNMNIFTNPYIYVWYTCHIYVCYTDCQNIYTLLTWGMEREEVLRGNFCIEGEDMNKSVQFQKNRF
jgi:hypothetical protein